MAWLSTNQFICNSSEIRLRKSRPVLKCSCETKMCPCMWMGQVYPWQLWAENIYNLAVHKFIILSIVALYFLSIWPLIPISVTLQIRCNDVQFVAGSKSLGTRFDETWKPMCTYSTLAWLHTTMFM